MIQSMTGYGKASAEFDGKKITVEIKTLNSKQIDFLSRIAPQYREKEIEIRNEIIQILERGKVELNIYTDNSSGANSVQINAAVVESYYRQIAAMAENLQIAVPADWLSALLRLPDMVKLSSDAQEVSDAEWQALKSVLLDALNRLVDFRRQEGEALQKVLEAKIHNIEALSREVNRYEAERIEKVRNRLHENLLSISEKVDYDKNRLEQELIFYIEKMDVNEEKVRLANHLHYFLQTMQEETSTGKKLGFIAQEIGREINTLGSKANHSEMQKLVVLMKDELEQIKEQVLNVL